jgi:hypothetical protein
MKGSCSSNSTHDGRLSNNSFPGECFGLKLRVGAQRSADERVLHASGTSISGWIKQQLAIPTFGSSP